MIKEVKDNKLYYFGYDLYELAKEFKTPLKITFLDIIKYRVKLLKNSFNKAIKKNSYNGKYIYLGANKANYSKEEILESFKYNDGLETSSYYDLLMTERFFEKYKKYSDKYIVSNGYKYKDYLNEVINVSKKYKFIDIIDSIEEYNALKETNLPIEIGLRIHIPSAYSIEEENDRFGLVEDEFKYIIDDVKNTNLKLTTIHFHQRGFDYEDDKFVSNFSKVFQFYVYAKKRVDTVINYNMGGGSPLPFNKDFDYNKWADKVIKLIIKLCNENNIDHPNLISENGKYNVKDSIVNIYKVIAKKHTDKYTWNIVDGSLLIALPEMYALGEPIDVVAINDLNKPLVKAKLAGVTCDCDDVYFNHKTGYIELPDSDNLYISCLGTGSYQNSMNGKGGIHHCLLPEEKDVIIYKRGNKIIKKVRHELQSIDDIFKKLKL